MSYLLQEDGVSKIILEDGSGFLLLEDGGGVTPSGGGGDLIVFTTVMSFLLMVFEKGYSPG